MPFSITMTRVSIAVLSVCIGAATQSQGVEHLRRVVLCGVDSEENTLLNTAIFPSPEHASELDFKYSNYMWTVTGAVQLPLLVRIGAPEYVSVMVTISNSIDHIRIPLNKTGSPSSTVRDAFRTLVRVRNAAEVSDDLLAKVSDVMASHLPDLKDSTPDSREVELLEIAKTDIAIALGAKNGLRLNDISIRFFFGSLDAVATMRQEDQFMRVCGIIEKRKLTKGKATINRVFVRDDQATVQWAVVAGPFASWTFNTQFQELVYSGTNVWLPINHELTSVE